MSRHDKQKDKRKSRQGRGLAWGPEKFKPKLLHSTTTATTMLPNMLPPCFLAYPPPHHTCTHLHVRKLPPKGKDEVHEGDRGGHPGAQAHRVPLTHGLRFRPGVPVCTHTRWESGREGGWEAVVQVCTQRAGSRGAGCRGSEVVLKRACEHTSRHVQA